MRATFKGPILATLIGSAACSSNAIAPSAGDASASDTRSFDAGGDIGVTGDAIAVDAACAASGQSCAISACCTELSEMCLPQGADRVCVHAIPPPRQGAECNGATSSSLAGVKIEFVDASCAYTLAQVAAGIKVNYRIVVDADVPGVHPAPQDAGGCNTPDPAIGLIVGFGIAGANQRYCLCDVGLCPQQPFATTAHQGTFNGSVAWDGRNWSGPSDTNNKPGAPFPPGTYTLTVRATGAHDKAGGGTEPFEVSAIRFLTLDP